MFVCFMALSIGMGIIAYNDFGHKALDFWNWIHFIVASNLLSILGTLILTTDFPWIDFSKLFEKYSHKQGNQHGTEDQL